MDRIVDQLAFLERGARVQTRPLRPHNNSVAAFPTYDEAEMNDDFDQGHAQSYYLAEGDFEEEPPTFDPIDERLLRQSNYNSHQSQAAPSRSRVSLPPNMTRARSRDEIHPPQPARSEYPVAQRPDLSRFAFASAHHDPRSSSPSNEPHQSSPTFKASQRRSTPVNYARSNEPHIHQIGPLDVMPSSRYQALGVEDIDVDEADARETHMRPAQGLQPRHGSMQSARDSRNKETVPVVQGISLVSTHALPDRFRAIFPYPLFNAVQSKTFETIYKTNDNFVLSAPTGSGKTAVLELAICRLINSFAGGSYKIVYQAPTKSLCAERQRDWQAKFAPLDLQCAELTGDTDNAQLRNVQNAAIIVTTPEKWDSITRKWKDHEKLMQMVKLFLIDEVHILKEDRGATLEAVVSRMKSVGSDVRFVALSATVPNAQDIATWLGKDRMNPNIAASMERLGEEFRPVKLQKHVCGYNSTASNDFGFEKMLSGKLPDVIAKWSQRKPIMIFCFTRNACVDTAKTLSNWWGTKGSHERYWSSPRKRITVADKDLLNTVSSGVAFHHAGLDQQDRMAVEKAYLDGDINVICCTSTLAVGVNLPCHMVIIKHTVVFHGPVINEYSDLEIMQMIGRAGRPQFDDSAVAVILTRQQRVSHYEKMITGQEILESCLHRNLTDHLNAEIGLGTISGVASAKKWLTSTFLYVRLKEHPQHYNLQDDAPGRNLDERLENICRRAITSLEDHDLVICHPKLQCTEFGDAMARYYLQFDTMKVFLALPPKSKVSEILSAISRAAEFKEIRFRAGEKSAYKDLNKNGSIKFPIPVDLQESAHKVSLVIQSVLGAVELPTEDSKHRHEYVTAKAIIFQHAHRLIRCIVDCQLYLEDSTSARNALMLARSIGAEVWDDSPLHMKQLDRIGIVGVRKLVAAGINSIEELEMTEARRIEHAMSRNPPYGIQLQDQAKAFPKLRISLKMMGEPVIKKGEHVTVNLKAEIGFLNDKVPEVFHRKPVYVCMLAETSDGKQSHFARVSAKKLNKGQDVSFSAILTNAAQIVRASVMCDEIAGTMRHANLKPDIPPIAFPPPKVAEAVNQQKTSLSLGPNGSKRRTSTTNKKTVSGDDGDEFGDDDIDDADLVRAEADGFIDIDDFEKSGEKSEEPKRKKRKTDETRLSETWEPQLLASGKWACNHTCKDKTSCKHLCCREGLDKKPKQPKQKENRKQTESEADPKQTQLKMSVQKKADPQAPRSVDKASASDLRKTQQPKEARDLDRLHNSVKTNTPKITTLNRSGLQGKGATPHIQNSLPHFVSLEAAEVDNDNGSSDYGNDVWDLNDLQDMGELPTNPLAPPMSTSRETHGSDDHDKDMLDATHGDFVDLSQLSGGKFGNDDMDPLTISEAQFNLDDVLYDADDLVGNNPNLQEPKANPSNGLCTAEGGHLFVGYASDSAAQDLGLQGPCSDSKQHAPGSPESSSKFFAESKDQNDPPPSPAQLREEAKRLERALPADQFLADVADATAVQPSSVFEQPDSPHGLRRWFEEEFDMKHFNLLP